MALLQWVPQTDQQGYITGFGEYASCMRFPDNFIVDDFLLLPEAPAGPVLRQTALHPVPISLWPGWQRHNRPPFDRVTVGGRLYDRSGTHRTWFRGQFPTADAEASAFVHDALAALEECCSRRVSVIDLASGDALRAEEDPWTCYGRSYAKWCGAADNRLLGQSTDEQGRRLGYRPA